MKARIRGDRELIATLNALPKIVQASIKDQLKVAMLAIKSTAVKKIQQGPASGRIYKKYKKDGGGVSGYHQASAPGQPPMTDEGGLVASIQSKVYGWSAYVWTELDYGAYLEYGTANMEPRPWLRPSFEEHRDKIPKQFGDAIIKTIRQKT